MSRYKLILGNKTYSSWSLRGWLIAKLAGITFDEEVIFLRQADTREKILRFNPAGKVPALIEDGQAIWDSLAIGEYLAERYPDRGLWPDEPAARRLARSVVAEMHAGFQALRAQLPMDLSRRYPGHPISPEVAVEIDRIQAIWRDCRGRFGQDGDFLFGNPGIADAFFAPVATRFVTFEVSLDETAAAYCETIMTWPLMREWTAEAEKETAVIEFF